MPPRRRDPANAGSAVRAALEPVLAWLDSGTAGKDAGSDPAHTGTAGKDAGSDPVGSDPAHTGTAGTGPASTDPAGSDPASDSDDRDPVPQPPRPVLAAAVRVSLRTFADLHPGRAVEVRVPPFAAVQCLSGLTHTRGNPPNVIETDARGWLSLVTGKLSWDDAVATDVVRASGHRTGEIGPLLPMRY